jgi:hypothetical protein
MKGEPAHHTTKNSFPLIPSDAYTDFGAISKIIHSYPACSPSILAVDFEKD